MKRTLIKILVSILLLPILSVLIVSATPIMIPANIEDREGLHHAEFGLPIPFITQDISTNVSGYEGGFPHSFSLQMDFLDHNILLEFNLENFLLSAFTMYLFFLLCYGLLLFLRSKRV